MMIVLRIYAINHQEETLFYDHQISTGYKHLLRSKTTSTECKGNGKTKSDFQEFEQINLENWFI